MYYMQGKLNNWEGVLLLSSWEVQCSSSTHYSLLYNETESLLCNNSTKEYITMCNKELVQTEQRNLNIWNICSYVSEF